MPWLSCSVPSAPPFCCDSLNRDRGYSRTRTSPGCETRRNQREGDQRCTCYRAEQSRLPSTSESKAFDRHAYGKGTYAAEIRNYCVCAYRQSTHSWLHGACLDGGRVEKKRGRNSFCNFSRPFTARKRGFERILRYSIWTAEYSTNTYFKIHICRGYFVTFCEKVLQILLLLTSQSVHRNGHTRLASRGGGGCCRQHYGNANKIDIRRYETYFAENNSPRGGGATLKPRVMMKSAAYTQ